MRVRQLPAADTRSDIVKRCLPCAFQSLSIEVSTALITHAWGLHTVQ